jgi:beta-glucanase (GH16 family)
MIFHDEFDNLTFFNSVSGQGNWKTTGLYGEDTQGMKGWGAEFDINPLTNTLGLNPYSVASGVLTITTDVASPSVQSQIGNYQYTTGAMRSVNVTLGYGYYEMRAQLPSGNGMWPAFWLLPADGGWPPEIDIFEVLGNSPTTLFTTVHSTTALANYSQKFADDHYSVGAALDVGVDMTAGFHTYGLDFGPDKITWYFDGTARFSTPTPGDLKNREVYIAIDNALGGWSGNAVDASTRFPTQYKIDYVRVYESKP